jgi:RNA polymerase sigma factor (sigma-70 family)
VQLNPFERENELLKGLANQNREAIDTIYRLNYPVVEHMVLNHKGTTDDAADIFQESIIILYEKSKDPGFQLHCLIKTYLYSVARRLWLKRLQRNFNKNLQINDIEEFIETGDDAEDQEKQRLSFQQMEIALSKIGEPCKSIIEAYYLKNKNMQEIAAAFNYTNADNAKTQKYKCMVRLKKLFFAAFNQIKQ